MPVPVPAPAPHRAPRPGLEERIGGVWLQNAGSVLVLLGVFFLILWGYTTGRLGPGILVGAAAALGLALAWRGDRMARSLPAFGYALVGVGLGVVYLSLYLGHFTLHVLARGPALVLLTLVSLASVAIGLHRCVQTIAALGVVGAFVPVLLGAALPLRGFAMSPGGLLAYLAVVNVAVFALAARALWSGLDLAALTLSAVTWVAVALTRPSGWPEILGLAALFTALGLAPLPRLAARGSVRAVDLAVVTAAPLALLVSTGGFLAAADRMAVGAFLTALALVYAGAALWMDARRAERDLWRALVGAAVVFLTAGLQRFVGAELTALAWMVEGTLLVWLGLRSRGGWLRLCGTAVTAAGGLWMAYDLMRPGTWGTAWPPVVGVPGVREGLGAATLLLGSALLARRRHLFSAEERFLPEAWAAAGNLALALWSAREGGRAAADLDVYAAAGAEGAAARGMARAALGIALVATAWIAQAAVLLGRGLAPGRGFLRALGYGLAAMAWISLLPSQIAMDPWTPLSLAVLHPIGILALACIAALLALAAWLAACRDRLPTSERSAPEALTVAGHALLLAWTAREGAHLAAAAGAAASPAVRTLGAVYASLGWTLQALALLVAGWWRGSSFLRWLGLGLFGLTSLKFLLHDLQTVDVFWRFLLAIVVGVVLLGVSYAYQRRGRAAAGPARGPGPPG